jgi:hypothetical protein
MPEQMLMYRAATFFCRVFCPEVLAGVATADEIIDIGDYDGPKSNAAIQKFNEAIVGTPFEDIDEAAEAEPDHAAADATIVQDAEVVSEAPADQVAGPPPPPAGPPPPTTEDDDF